MNKREDIIAADPTATALATAVTAMPARLPGEQQLDFDSLPGNLTEQQKRVLQTLYNYRTLAEAADSAGCNRSTIFRWRAQNETFRIAYRLMRLEQRLALEADAQTLAEDALLGLRLAIAQGDDPRLNLAVLKALGRFKKEEEDPEPDLPYKQG